jgi:large subunit ribosomal protein L6
MSKIAKKPIIIPAGLEVSIKDNLVTVTNLSNKKSLTKLIANAKVIKEGNELLIQPLADIERSSVHAGTIRSLLNNIVIGLSKGFEKKLQLVGVGYRVQAQKIKDGTTKLNLTLGFSHPVEYIVPAEVEVETPTQTEIVLKSSDKQRVGQVAAEIRAFRPPEPYKGKGVRDVEEVIIYKEGKKK